MGRCIVIADANVDAAESLALLLQLHGHETHTAYTGPAALDAVTRFHPDAVFLALTLPNLDGFEVCRRLKTGEATPCSAKIVALTGSGQEQERRAILAAGFDYHLLKPADPKAILAILH